MFLAAFCFAVMGLCTRFAHEPVIGRPLPAAEVTLFRFVFGALVMLPLQGRRGIDLRGADRVGLAVRGVWGGLAVYLYFLSLHYTSLANAQLLNYTSIIFAPLFAAITLRERVTRRAAIAVCVAATGITLITWHGLGGPKIGDTFGLLSGICAGGAITSIRKLRQTESSFSVFFYLCLVGVPVALTGCLFQHPVMPTAAGWAVLGLLGVTSVGGQVMMTYGYKFVRAAEGGVIGLSQLVYTLAVGAVWLGEPITRATFAGGALILGAALWLSFAPAQSRASAEE